MFNLKFLIVRRINPVDIFRPIEGGIVPQTGPQDQSGAVSPSNVGRVSPNMGILVRGRLSFSSSSKTVLTSNVLKYMHYSIKL